MRCRYELQQWQIASAGRSGRRARLHTTRSGATAPKPKIEKVKPFYDGDGQPCCPTHKKPLKEGQYGLYCSCKAKDGELANDKGYCNLRFFDN